MRKNKYRILHLIHHLRIGGAERMVLDIMEGLLHECQYTITCAVLSSGGELENKVRELNIPLVNLNKEKDGPLKTVVNLRKVLLSQKIEILHMHSFSAAMWGRFCSIGTGIKIRVITEHGIAGWGNYRKHFIVNKLLLPFTSKIVSVSKAASKSIIEKQKINSRYIRVIPNGIQFDHFLRCPPKEECRKIHFLPDSIPVVGMAARNSMEKGIDLFIKAIAILKNNGVEVIGVIAGDGQMHKELRNLAETLNVTQNVRFLGAVAPVNIPQVLNSFDIGICPSRYESFGLAAIEMMAAGKAVIVTDTGGLPEIILNGKTGIVVQKENPAALAEAIRMLIEDVGYRDNLASRGREFVLGNYSSERMIHRYIDLYNELINSAGL